MSAFLYLLLVLSHANHDISFTIDYIHCLSIALKDLRNSLPLELFSGGLISELANCTGSAQVMHTCTMLQHSYTNPQMVS